MRAKAMIVVQAMTAVYGAYVPKLGGGGGGGPCPET